MTKEGKGFDNCPFETLEEMHRTIKENWNARISNGDNVYILGDVAMRGTILLYGHVQNTLEEDYFQECLDGMYG